LVRSAERLAFPLKRSDALRGLFETLTLRRQQHLKLCQRGGQSLCLLIGLADAHAARHAKSRLPRPVSSATNAHKSSMYTRTTRTARWFVRLEIDSVEQVIKLAFAQRDADSIRSEWGGYLKRSAVEALVTQDEMHALRSQRPSL
jgi:hypothetical protein